MSRTYAFPVLGHGTMDPDGFFAWVVFREPPPVTLVPALIAKAPPLLTFDAEDRFDRMVGVYATDSQVYEDESGYQALLADFDRWLEVVNMRHPLAFAVILDGDTDDPNDERDAWSKKRVPELLPWFAEHWPAFASPPALLVLNELVGRAVHTRDPATIEAALAVLERGIADLVRFPHDGADGVFGGYAAHLLGHLPKAEARRRVARLSPYLRLLVGAEAERDHLVPRSARDVLRDLDAVLAGPARAGLGAALAALGDKLGASELQERALALPGAPVDAFLELASVRRGEALDKLLDEHFAMFARGSLREILYRALVNDSAPLIARCLAAAADRLDDPELVANVLYATSRAGKMHESIRLAQQFVPRYRASHEGPMLATLYTNILLAYGGAATCDDVARSVTLELEQLLESDPDYFREDGAGGASADILGSAYGSAACGRAVMNDGAAAARWLEKSAGEDWSELAVCSNLVCFQHMKDDPHLRPVVAAIARKEVARLEAALADGEDVRALFSLALTLHNGMHLDDAERYYRRVLAIDPKHADSLNNLGNVMGTRGRYDEAIALYDQAIAEIPDHPLFHACRGWALARAKRYAEAIATCDRAVAIDPNQSGGYFPRGAAYLGIGDRVRATADFKRGAELNPSWRGSEKDDPWFAEMAKILDATAG